MPSESPYPYVGATPEQRAIGSWWWCVHHEVHMEQLTEPVKARVSYIMRSKPPDERDTRLRELAPVLHPERLPQRVTQTRAEYGRARAESTEAWAEHNRALAEYGRAWAESAEVVTEYYKAVTGSAEALAEYDKALAECESELVALHREEYPETKWNGKSIFGALLEEEEK